MRFTIIVFLPFLFLACDRVEEVQSLEEFDVPYEKDVVKKTYTYIRQPQGDTLRHIYLFGEPGEGKYLQTIYSGPLIISERVYQVNGNRRWLSAEYIYEYNEFDSTIFEKQRGEIKAYEEREVGHRIKGWKAKISFTNEEDERTTIEEEGKAIKDTVLLWGNKPVKAIKVNYSISETRVIKYVPFIHLYDWESDEVVYYGEEIGFLKHTAIEDGILYEINLFSIEKEYR